MLAQSAQKIFQETLLRIDVKQAVQRALKVENVQFLIGEEKFSLEGKFSIYVIAIGKAAYPMAVGFNEVAGKFVKGGIVSGIISGDELDEKWQIFAGGHPVPNEESFRSARAAFELLKKADSERALVVFLISGGGSAMMDLPQDEEISLSDLQDFNQALITSGAAIAEINSVRRIISQVKGGGLALSAPNAKQISLIISDTADGDISSVASGPSLFPAEDIPNPLEIIDKYHLKSKIPFSIKRVLENYQAKDFKGKLESSVYVLLDNNYMLEQAAKVAKELGFAVKIAEETDDVFITEGCKNLLSNFIEMKKENTENKPFCFISGGEFGCKVVGKGLGGRNSETVLRLILSAQNKLPFTEYAVLSAGTDGIDGNSPAAGAIADQRTLKRALSEKLNPVEYLENSDSFSFFNNLGDAIIVGATGTNVRDVRILLAK